MRVYYVNERADTVISLEKLSKLRLNDEIIVNHNGRNIPYTVKDIYDCKDWKTCTIDSKSLTLEDIRYLMSNVDETSDVYEKLKSQESILLNLLVEDITFDEELERSLF